MRIIKTIFIGLLSLAIALALAWCIMTYLVWPKPEILGLVPDAPLAYVSASGLSEALADAQESEFASRVVRSPLWKQLKSSRMWRQAKNLKRAWEKRSQLAIKPGEIIQLVGQDAVLAFYGEKGRLDILLVSEVGVVTRMNIKSGRTEKAFSKVYKIVKEKYKGAELITMSVPQLKFSYGFIGRAGMLSSDISLLRKAVDLHKGTGQETPERRKLVTALPKSDISFYIDAAKIRAFADHPIMRSLISDSRLNYLTTVVQHTNAWAGAGFHQSGDMVFDLRTSYTSTASSEKGDAPVFHPNNLDDLLRDDLPIPADCLLFAGYEMLEPGVLFETLGTIIGANTKAVSDKLLPVLRQGAAAVIMEPNLEELQILPPVMVFFQMKDKTATQAIMRGLSASMTFRGRQLNFTEAKYANVIINHARVPIGMGMSIDAGYTFIGDDLLVMATDTSALELAIDVSFGKRQSLMKDPRYINVLDPIIEASEGRVFVNISSAAAMTKRAGKLYSFRAKLAGEREAERIAAMLYQNVFILEAWQFMGIAFDFSEDKVNVRMALDAAQ